MIRQRELRGPRKGILRAPLEPASARRELAEDPMQFIWAISYSDLLMVLMSFFVIYFEMSAGLKVPATQTSSSTVASSPSHPFERVILALKDQSLRSSPIPSHEVASEHAVVTPDSQASSQALVPPAVRPREPSEALARAELRFQSLPIAGLSLQSESVKREILIHFPPQMYAKGQFAAEGETRDRIEQVLRRILPLADRLNVTIIGHTDELRVVRKRHHFVDSNLVLSNLRAARAVEVAVQMGFDPRFVQAQGVGEYSRASRSLSLRLTERGEP